MFETTVNHSHTARDMMDDLLKKQEQYLLDQLSELVNRGIIVIERTQPVLTSYELPNGNRKITMGQAVRLVPKEKEYIEKLERRIESLKQTIAELK